MKCLENIDDPHRRIVFQSFFREKNTNVPEKSIAAGAIRKGRRQYSIPRSAHHDHRQRRYPLMTARVGAKSCLRLREQVPTDRREWCSVGKRGESPGSGGR
ncbi:hypothetical protein TNIN_78671 [Trichonephila inaurata madagascariensis]|uniref:Uncharacterized protein n=1 Tax=Trichonephila inaurata madagascariensis TaxID=2747483 RepID=A0A8X6XN91_9ARAC|nr:hypothetical protein TNIN_78671 [Trichonephila inaurata madagascariensis]